MLQDNDITDDFNIPSNRARRLFSAAWRDVAFLAQNNILDYSMLIGSAKKKDCFLTHALSTPFHLACVSLKPPNNRLNDPLNELCTINLLTRILRAKHRIHFCCENRKSELAHCSGLATAAKGGGTVARGVKATREQKRESELVVEPVAMSLPTTTGTGLKDFAPSTLHEHMDDFAFLARDSRRDTRRPPCASSDPEGKRKSEPLRVVDGGAVAAEEPELSEMRSLFLYLHPLFLFFSFFRLR